jgi:hypothetical protein
MRDNILKQVANEIENLLELVIKKNSQSKELYFFIR